VSAPIEVCCACCDEFGRHGGRRLRNTCYNRRLKAGTLDGFPPLGAALPRLWRLEEYTELRARGVSIRKAAERLGVTDRTAARYEAHLKAPQAAA
jgi:transcriptional regulator with XRE-family HTH domain